MNQAQKIADSLSDRQKKIIVNQSPKSKDDYVVVRSQQIYTLPDILWDWVMGRFGLNERWRLTPLGKEVKAILEKQS